MASLKVAGKLILCFSICANRIIVFDDFNYVSNFVYIYAVRVRPFNNREREMGAKCIVEMDPDGRKTRLKKPKHLTIDNSNAVTSIRDNYNDFTFDFSYWSFDDDDHSGRHIVTQEEVYSDLGMDVINCAFQGK